MRQFKNIIPVLMLSVLCSCGHLDLYPLDQPSKETWYETEEQIEMSLNSILRHKYWAQERYEFTGSSVMDMDEITDDMMRRNSMVSFKNGTLNSTQAAVRAVWANSYEAITICNNILENMPRLKNTLTEEKYAQYEGAAKFYRASLYSRIVILYGDPIYFTKDLSLDVDAYTVSRTPVATAIENIYQDFNDAINGCPVTWSGVNRATKGAAYAMKARFALYVASVYKYDDNLKNLQEADKHYKIARDAAKSCMDLNTYTLYPDYGELFLSKTKNASESIFCIPRSVAYAEGDKTMYFQGTTLTANLPIGLKGNVSEFPSLDLFFSYICTDGKPIDKSPLYDPKDPFKNRDPRLTYSFAEWGKDFCGIVYDPRFNVPTVLNAQGEMVTNPDNIITASESRLPSRTMMVQKKGVDEDWIDDMQTDPDKIIIRLADVLLMYAEAKIELNEIDATVLNAINQVRARAYKADVNQTDKYPAVTTTKQAELRTVVRTERRMEFAFERLRIYDIHRWRISEKVLNYSEWCIKYNAGNAVLLSAMDNPTGIFPTPTIDDSGCPEMDLAFRNANYAWLTPLYVRSFNPDVHYLWPIPAGDMLMNKNIKQNFGY